MILVTGGAGFIGSNLIAELEARGAGAIVVCDHLGDDQKWRNIAKREIADLISPDSLGSFVESEYEKIDAIFHLGAISSTTEFDVDKIIEINFRMSKDLWISCTRYQIPFIYASSAATYGDGSQGFSDNNSRSVLAQLQPLNPYGWSKHLFDRWVVGQSDKGKNSNSPIYWAGLKFFNVYGPNEYHKGGQISVALKNFREITEGGSAVLFRSHHPDYADGEQMRDFVWVEDCVDVMIWLKENANTCGIFNIGTGRARSFTDLARAVFSALDKKENIHYVDTPFAIRKKYQYFTQADMKRLRVSGYKKSFTGLEKGVAKYVRNYLLKDDSYR